MSEIPEFPETMRVLQALGTALGLGLLVGLQREWVRDEVAGIRTFGLTGLFGGIAGLLAGRGDMTRARKRAA